MDRRVVILFCLVIFFISIIAFGLSYTDGKSNSSSIDNEVFYLKNLIGMDIDEVREYALDNELKLQIIYEYDDNILEGKIISQNIEKGKLVRKNEEVIVVVSKGKVPVSVYQENKVNELGHIPIMMYHGIVNMKNTDTDYTGGNVDKDGYNRTVEAFREDLEFYYRSGYRIIRLQDYVDGVIEVELGKSPVILTFDDGNKNNFNVLGEENGELIIDPNCAVGVLEEYKSKYPDYGVTATFFVNSGLFEQDEYNKKILKWLVGHGYDIGNHTMSHVDFTKIGKDETIKEVGGLYQKLEEILSEDYVSIVALPFGSPYTTRHTNYEFIVNGNYLGNNYHTIAMLRVGWEAEVSCFNRNFNPLFLKRIRAYDNNGEDFDIEMNFKILEKTRYISDGNKDSIVILEKDRHLLGDFGEGVITYSG